jgi:hypothetical protein
VLAFFLAADVVLRAHLSRSDLFFEVAFIAFAVVSAIAGAVIIVRQPRNVIGWLLLVIPLWAAFAFMAGDYATYALVTAPGALPFGRAAAWIDRWAIVPAAALAEPDPGVSADAAVLAAGGAVIVAMLVTRVAWPARRLASAGARPGGAPAVTMPRSRSAARPAAIVAPVTAAVGVRLAVESGRGRTAVPVRSALAGTVLSVLAVTAALTFGANLLHLVNSPPLYGKRWDAAIDVQFATISPAAAGHQFGRLPGIVGWTYGQHGIIAIAGHVIPAIGLAAGKGPLLSPTLLQGRPPGNENEIVLGTSTLRQIGRHVGQTVTVTVSGRTLRERIVGRAVFPNFGQGSFTPTDLGQGAETTAAVLKAQAVPYGAPPGFQFVLLSFTPGPNRPANIASFQRSMTSFCQTIQQSTCVITSQRPNGATNYASIDRIPAVLAALLAVIGVAVLGQFIVVSGRRRRRDFAIFKALGMRRGQISAITAWQVSTLTGLALLAGLPLGVAAGRWSWALFAHGLGIPPGAITPIRPVVLMTLAAIVIANAVAFWPGRASARLSPAEVLRAE